MFVLSFLSSFPFLLLFCLGDRTQCSQETCRSCYIYRLVEAHIKSVLLLAKESHKIGGERRWMIATQSLTQSLTFFTKPRARRNV